MLPFVDMSSAKDQEYFSDGISELLNLLAKIPQLQVTARTSYSLEGALGIEGSRKLHVAHVLEGKDVAN